MMWCRYFKDGQPISEVVKCDESLLAKGSNLMVQISEDREKLLHAPNFKEDKVKKLDEETVNKLKEYRDAEEWNLIRQTVFDYTGQNLCCQSAIEQFMSTL